MDVLIELRKKIDQIDEDILTLFAKRFAIVKEIGKIKKAQNMPTKDNKREKEKIVSLVKKGQEKGISKDFITKILNELFTQSYKLET